MGQCLTSDLSMRMRFLWSDRDRHGNVRYYLARPGHRKIRIRGEPGSPEFADAYANALAGRTAALGEPLKQEPPAPSGSLRAVIATYTASADFTRLDASTQRVRRAILERLCTARFDGDTMPHGDKPFASMPIKAIRRMRDALADRPEAANTMLKALRQVYAFALREEVPGVIANLARDVPSFASHNPDGFHTWTLEEVRAYEARHPTGTMARLAFDFLLYTAQRRSDVILFGRQHVREGWITLTQRKNHRRKPITISIPIVPPLAASIAATKTGDLTFLVTEHGRPFASSNSFGNKFRDWCDAAGLGHCSAHGLRKACASRLAELGCSDKQIASITGHRSTKELEKYTRAAQQRVLAQGAVGKLARVNKR